MSARRRKLLGFALWKGGRIYLRWRLAMLRRAAARRRAAERRRAALRRLMKGAAVAAVGLAGAALLARRLTR